MPESALLHCPIRGNLRVSQRASDGLTFTEEKQRIDAIRYLLQRLYPKENFGIETTLFRLGNSGRNSFRTDFAIYDKPFDDIKSLSLEDRLEHIRILAEIKRDNRNAEEAKATQVKAALNLIPDLDAYGVYWDDLEQRFFYRQIEGKKARIHEAAISKIPAWEENVISTRLSYVDLLPARDMVRIFDQIEHAMHALVVDKVERYSIIQQLLLSKIHDENIHRSARLNNAPLAIQDYSSEEISGDLILAKLNTALEKAADHYNRYLPETKRIAKKFNCSGEALREATKLLAPVNILGSKVQVIQQFYMKFAKSLYKWDLAQYFTPHEVIDFIVDLVNPQPEEHVYDPACGSADFLISAFRKLGSPRDVPVWGADHSEQAVQISILNMVINGDGKTQIKQVDSLAAFDKHKPLQHQYSIVLCNPPFGNKIRETRASVLENFEMGYRWERSPSGKGTSKTEIKRTSQQTGILFAELCLRLADSKRGRVGIILPNGYLGNRSLEYTALREWLLRNARIAGIIAFPRFTFKKSGADVSASVLILERRQIPLSSSDDSEDYSFYVGNIQSVGWRAGDKKAVPMYMRNQEDGSLVLDAQNEPMLDADFDAILNDFVRSPASDCFSWILSDLSSKPSEHTEGISIREVLQQSDLSLDPKRYSSKYRATRNQITSRPYLSIGDVLEIVPYQRVRRQSAKIYLLVEIEQIGVGEYGYVEQRGWQLPDRAKLKPQKGDIFIAHLWGSAGKWFMAPTDCDDLIVTNGCAHLRLKSGCADLLPDLLVGLCSELFNIQVRALATGSDGLAEISDEDLLRIVLPKAIDKSNKEIILQHLDALLTGEATFARLAREILKQKQIELPLPRKSHWVLV